MTERATLFEVGPRDGLQNEPGLIATADKIRLVDMLGDAGLTRIEVTSFVSPAWVPQMADAAEVLAGIARRPGVSYSALTPNLKGFQRAEAAGADAVAVFGAASESFSRKNINCSIAESLERFGPVLDAARAAGVPVRGYISCVTDCPFEGHIAPAAVAQVARELLAMGCHEISLGDTIGQGTPGRVDAMLSAVLEEVPVERLAGHFHDTNGRALDNIEVALARGLRVFDAAAGGLGGCPYAPGAAGNVASEAVVARLHALGYDTGVDEGRLALAADFARGLKTSAEVS
ncbi:hydroxymethylglutaryl-CoA lyase [Oceanibium sediminis]|uniref:hydroxymethylglutaryl-CoA lyase n=1 Tax=Oceanibium sediminis TaxID=2026339 RepID=UPI000DD2F459|nr:hydroxymethylglutaryl-CoA lyase [Oceanibium sediminis]